jgi:hypothetical protein
VVKLTVSVLYSTVGTGVGVTVGKGVAVAVGGSDVAVGVDVSVGGMGVWVGVAVGGGKVAVGGTSVAVGDVPVPQPLTVRTRKVTVKNNAKSFSIFILLHFDMNTHQTSARFKYTMNYERVSFHLTLAQTANLYLISMMDTGSSLRSIRAIVPVLTTTTASGIGNVNTHGTGLKKFKLNPLGA